MSTDRPSTSRQGRGWSTVDAGVAQSSATPNAARSELQPGLLQPPGGGLAIFQILGGRPPDGSTALQNNTWLTALAARVRSGEVSPERAIQSAYMFGEAVGVCSKLEPDQ